MNLFPVKVDFQLLTMLILVFENVRRCISICSQSNLFSASFYSSNDFLRCFMFFLLAFLRLLTIFSHELKLPNIRSIPHLNSIDLSEFHFSNDCAIFIDIAYHIFLENMRKCRPILLLLGLSLIFWGVHLIRESKAFWFFFFDFESVEFFSINHLFLKGIFFGE